MAEVYQFSSYDSLPMFSEAGKMFDAKRGDDLVEKFRILFQKHGLERVYGLLLNHRHFEMKPSERLVEYKGTSVPWSGMQDKILPSSWLVSETNQCLPYEFHYSADPGNGTFESPNDPKFDKFITAFNAILRSADALGLFGLCRYPGDDFEGRVEITEGRANINLHPNDAPKHFASRSAAWFFSPNLLGKCVCICGGNGHTSATHKGHVNSR